MKEMSIMKRNIKLTNKQINQAIENQLSNTYFQSTNNTKDKTEE